jgi:tight adherence protein C
VDGAHHAGRRVTAVWLGGAAGILVLELAGPVAKRARRHGHGTWRPSAGARHAGLVLGALVVGVVAPPLLPLAGAGWWGTREVRRRHAQAEQRRAIRHALPDLVDLLRLTTTAGLSLAVAHPVVAGHVPPPIGPALVAADVAATRGHPRADALTDALAPFGERAGALAHVLSDHLRYGVPLMPALERNGLELRLDRRRAAELDARRVPVRLLGPLVTCVLPAFALLTVVPLIAASLEALPV